MTVREPAQMQGLWQLRHAATYAFRALACIPVGAIYGVVLFLTRIAPDRRQHAHRHQDACPPDSHARTGIGAYLIRGSVALYRFSLVHDLMHRDGERCMFVPSCSEYADRAALKYGFSDALMMIGDRFRRCRADTTDDFTDFP